MGKRRCVNCRRTFLIERNKDQKYCSLKACQNKRCCLWQKQKQKHDSDYRANKKAAQQRWASKHPDYCRHYRARHPDYVTQNRQQQHRRNAIAKQRTTIESAIPAGEPGKKPEIVKTNALTQDFPFILMSYEVFCGEKPLIAKMNVLYAPNPLPLWAANSYCGQICLLQR